MQYEEEVLNVLKAQVKPALGCTEPIAVAIAVSRAYKEIGGDLKRIHVLVSPNVYKNGMNVGIPGTSEKGLYIAISLAVICGTWELGLEIFKDLKEKDVVKARTLLNSGIISLMTDYNIQQDFYIFAEVTTDLGFGRCVIEGFHTNIVRVEKNGKIVYEKTVENTDLGQISSTIKNLTIRDLKETVEKIPSQKLKFLLEGVRLNLNIAREGLNDKKRLNVGTKLQKMIDEGSIADDVVNRARVVTAAAADARMSGVKMSVMSSAGSGNHGLTTILPVFVVAKEMNCSEEQLMRALALSHIITIYIKEYTGRLSPICGCSIAAGVGASAAIAWLLGCNDEQIAGAIKNMIGNLAGMICDGAKRGCALKLSTAAAEAIISARLAKNGIIIPDFEGIVCDSAELTIKNLGKLCTEGMNGVDEKIIQIMLSQNLSKPARENIL